MKINYSEIYLDKSNFLQNINKFFGQEIKKREGADLPDLNINEKQNLPDKLFNELKIEIEKYDWENYDIQER